MYKFLTWLLCIILLLTAVAISSVHTLVTQRLDGGAVMVVVGCVIAIAIIATDRDAH